MRFSYLLVLASCLATPAFSQSTDTAQHVSAGSLSAGIAKPANGLAVLNVFKDPKANTVHVRRDVSGEAEIHANVNDVMIAHKGRVTLVLGGRVEGGRETGPGEWRGGEIVGGRTQSFKAGEMIWIPAGVPHHMLLRKGTSFTYSVVKTPR